VARAFNQFLNLANIAEQYQLIRRRDETSRSLSRRGTARTARPAQVGRAQRRSLARQLAKLEIELVLTAHPTEVARRT
jgi:phosphoenolpyruvate carboxylase